MPATIEHEIERAVDELMGGSDRHATSISRHRAEHVLANLAHRVKEDTSADVLLNLLTVEDVARRLGVSGARVRAKAIWRRKQGFPVGWQVPGTRAWLFRPEELGNLEPLPEGRPRKIPSASA